jgi:hypothetical protein
MGHRTTLLMQGTGGVLARLGSHLRETAVLTIRATASNQDCATNPHRLSHVGQALDILPGFRRPVPQNRPSPAIPPLVSIAVESTLRDHNCSSTACCPRQEFNAINCRSLATTRPSLPQLHQGRFPLPWNIAIRDSQAPWVCPCPERRLETGTFDLIRPPVAGPAIDCNAFDFWHDVLKNLDRHQPRRPAYVLPIVDDPLVLHLIQNVHQNPNFFSVAASSSAVGMYGSSALGVLAAHGGV